MKNRALPLFLLFIILLPSCLILQIKAKKQTEILTNIYKQKLKSNTFIDRSHFNASYYSSDEEHVHVHLLQEGLKEKDRIERLPGQPNVRFNQYGGYVTVNRTAGTSFYYYFIEAYRSKESLPLLLWLNGGPGCSSLGYGAMQELGPFRVNSDGKTLYKNKFAWNLAANVLFLESPAGVGFSYSNTKADFKNGGDRKTAGYNYAFLLNWLERFPEYKNRDFYISGESYAGHYVPQLAHTILFHNRRANKTIINLKGIIIGNAVINDETDLKGMYEYLVSHALIADETFDKIMKCCDFNAKPIDRTDSCYDALDEADENMGDIDVYNIYGPLCHNSSLTHEPKKHTSVLNLDPCGDDYVHAYMNRPEVQKAMHANITNIPYQWEACSGVIEEWHDSPTTIIPLLKELVSTGLRVWIFSGDTDGVVPVTATKYSIKQMNLSVKASWHPWYLAGEVGGYTQVYEGNLTLATIRGAGHQVPSYQPARALSLIMHFLAGTELPDSTRNF